MIVGKEYNSKLGGLLISYYKNGKINHLIKRIHKSDLYNWYVTPNATAYRNWDDRYVKPVPVRNPDLQLSQFRIEELIYSNLTEDEKKEVYDMFEFPKKTYLDIEIQLLDTSFPKPEEAKMPVNLITLCGENNNVIVLSTMQRLDESDVNEMKGDIHHYFRNIEPRSDEDAKILSQEFDVKYLYFNSEIDMMKFFFYKVLPKLSFITGWNVIKFDWLYLYNRALKLGLTPLKELVSGKIISNKTKIPLHLGILDYMEVMQKHPPLKVIENYKLDYISNLILNANKYPSNYSSMIEAQKDVKNFIKYNIIDTILVKMLDDKLSLLDVSFSISGVAKIDVNKVYSPVYITEMLMCREFLKNNKHMAKDGGNSNNDETVSYTGAFVSKPIPGYYDLVACFDFASMYPNVQMQFNISPDTFIGKGASNFNTNGCIVTKNDTVFANDKDGVARIILKSLYGERVNTKKLMKNLSSNKNSDSVTYSTKSFKDIISEKMNKS